MIIKVKTIDEQEFNVPVSKLTPISELRKKLKNLTGVKAEHQRLFYGGKQLENWYTLFDYQIKNNDVLQLMKINNQNTLGTEQPRSSSSSGLNITGYKPKEVTIPAFCKYFEVGDYVDVRDEFGAWFEARIVEIYRITLDCYDTTAQKERKEESCASDLYYKTVIDDKERSTFIEAPFQDIRPTARRKIKFRDLKKGDVVLVNYNDRAQKKIGNWYDFCVSKCETKRNVRELRGTLLLRAERSSPNTKICRLNEIFQIEKSYLLKNRVLADENVMKTPAHRGGQSINHCVYCNNHPKKKCKMCACSVCGEKKEPEKQMLCDECDKAYHIGCINPPLDQVPDVEWYCPECKIDENEIVKPGEMLKESNKRAKIVSKHSETEHASGNDMAPVGPSKDCTLVPPNHYGPIPGVEVGQVWRYRVQLSEIGVHRPTVAGIHGREKDGAYSLVLSGGYEDDIDNGNEFWYTGSGGRNLSGNRRTKSQSSDQKLTRMNKALALNCATELNEKGAEAKNWRKGKPVRVVRNHKASKHSKYAPIFGYRYDGIYKVVKYFPTQGKSGFIIWHYFLKRDDPTPAPWTPKGKEHIENLGLQIPEAPKGYETEDQEMMGQNTINKSKKKKKLTQDISAYSRQKKQKVEAHSLGIVEMKLMARDKLNKKTWEDCCLTLQEGKGKFLSVVREAFKCAICLELVQMPVTTPCKHNICYICLKRAKAAGVETCPCCRAPLKENFAANVNHCLTDLLAKMFRG